MDALLVIDVQNDFMPSGALPVTDGDAVVPVANTLMGAFGLVVATQDWHPSSHGSFASNHEGRAPGDLVDLGGVEQTLWPDHCVQGTSGASFHSGLDVASIDFVVRKGTDEGIDSYSGFFDNHHLRETGLADRLRQSGVTRVIVLGLATDYCVKYTALDAVELGFDVTVVPDGCRAVELSEGDGARALSEMSQAGCSILSSSELLDA